MRRLLLALPLVSSLACGDAFDGGACTQILVYGLNVTVTAADGTKICDATITARDGDYSEVLERPFEGSTDCTYSGAGERPGTYELEIKRRGFETEVIRDVVVEGGGCHVEPEKIDATIDPKAGCDPLGVPAVDVVVRDASGDRVCDAYVRAAQIMGSFPPSYDMVLAEAMIDGECGYRGAEDRAGELEILVESTGRGQLKKRVTVTEDDCHLATQRVDIMY